MPRSRRRKDAPQRLRERQQITKHQLRQIRAKRLVLSAEIQAAWDEALVIDAQRRFANRR